jgi:hypothetical protein
MTIEQTVEIPASHRLSLEILAPEEIPAGPAVVELKFTPIVENRDKLLSKTFNENATPHTDALLGILSGIGDISLDEIRSERLAKHLK